MADWRAVGKAYADQQGVPWEWFDRAINQESGWNPNVKDSKAGARGIAQLMPVHWTAVNPNDPRASLAYAAKYLRQNYDRFGSWPLAFAAYNMGPGNLSQLGTNIAKWPAETIKYLGIIFGAGWRSLVGGGGPEPGPVDPVEGDEEGSTSWGQFIGEGIVAGVKGGIRSWWAGANGWNVGAVVAGVGLITIGLIGAVTRSRVGGAATRGAIVGAPAGPAGFLGGAAGGAAGEALDPSGNVRSAIRDIRSARSAAARRGDNQRWEQGKANEDSQKAAQRSEAAAQRSIERAEKKAARTPRKARKAATKAASADHPAAGLDVSDSDFQKLYGRPRRAGTA